MKRREFLKYIGIGGAGAGLGFILGKVSKPPAAKLIPYLIPPEDIIPGVGNWYASLCTSCQAGCGIIVKVMEGRAKKVEGNPLHPISKGKLCSKGQALPQMLYNPDRIKGPLKRSGERGTGDFTEITWDEGLALLSKNLSEVQSRNHGDKLYFVSSPLRGHISGLAVSVLSALGSTNHIEYELFDKKPLLYANQVSMGINTVPHYDIENTKYLLSFGADLTVHGLSPVSYGYAYGQMRQGAGERGRLVQVEPKLSLTGANADEWIPARPGTEGVLALAIAYAIIDRGSYRGSDAGSWKAALSRFSPKAVAKTVDVEEAAIYKIAKEFMDNRPSLAIAGDAVAGYENGASAIMAVNILNHLAGNIGAKGGVIPNPEGGLRAEHRADFKNSIGRLAENAAASKVNTLLIYNANPVFTAPKAFKLEEALKKVPFIVSFSSFMDETTAMADLVLPAHTCLEDWGDDFAQPSVGNTVATIMQPAVSPVFNTMGLGDILISASKGAGGRLKERAGQGPYSEYLKNSWKEIYSRNKEVSAKSRGFEDFWEGMLANGGFWTGEQRRGASHASPKALEAHLPTGPAKFDGDGYPFYMVLYPSNQSGRGANVPWLQELPDQMTSAVWGTWVEINPKTAKELGLCEGDMVSVESPNGRITAPVYLYPGIRPDTVSVPVGQGHSMLGRYAKGRGANPIEILPAVEDAKTGAIAYNSTRVKIAKVSGPGGPNGLIKMEGSTKELGRGIVQTVTNAEFRKMKKEAL